MGNISELSAETLKTYFEHLDHGEKMLDASPVTAGMENTTYRIQSESGDHYYFTLFEHLTTPKVSQYVALLGELARLGLPVPRVTCRGGNEHIGQHLGIEALHKAKPWVICPEIPGISPEKIGWVHCAEIGRFLGQLHQQKSECFQSVSGFPWADVFAKLRQQFKALLPQEAAWCQKKFEAIGVLDQQVSHLPWALGHGDLFPDNALFQNAELTGVIDFFNAYYGPRVYDLAVVINAWCSQPQGQLDEEKVSALIYAYQRQVRLTVLERQQLPGWLFLAGFRFWTSRWLARHQYAEYKAHLKDPAEYAAIVDDRLDGMKAVRYLVNQTVA